MNRKTAARSLVALAMGSALLAHAASVASTTVSLDGLQVQLVDLTPGDGRAPGYTEVPGWFSAQASGWAVDPWTGLPGLWSREASGPSSVKAYHDPDDFALAGGGPSKTLESLRLVAAATSSATAEAFVRSGFRLAPWTEIIVSADSHVDVTGADGKMGTSFLSLSDGPDHHPEDAFSAEGSGSRRLEVSWRNDASYAKDVNFAIGVRVSSVPEPGEWLLMLGGLAILGAVASRRPGARRG